MSCKQLRGSFINVRRLPCSAQALLLLSAASVTWRDGREMLQALNPGDLCLSPFSQVLEEMRSGGSAVSHILRRGESPQGEWWQTLRLWSCLGPPLTPVVPMEVEGGAGFMASCTSRVSVYEWTAEPLHGVRLLSHDSSRQGSTRKQAWNLEHSLGSLSLFLAGLKSAGP